MTDLGVQPHLHRPPPRVIVSVYPSVKCSQRSAPHRSYEEREASKSPPNSRTPWGCRVLGAPALLKNQNKRSSPAGSAYAKAGWSLTAPRLGSGSMRGKAVTFIVAPGSRMGFPGCISAPPNPPPTPQPPGEAAAEEQGAASGVQS